MKGILQIHYEHLWEISAYIFNESNIYIQNITTNLGVPYYYICSPKIHSILKPIVGNQRDNLSYLIGKRLKALCTYLVLSIQTVDQISWLLHPKQQVGCMYNAMYLVYIGSTL